MSGVKRYSVEAPAMDLHLEHHSLGTIERVVVMASDYEAALAREAALREQNNLLRHDVASYLETTAKVCELLGVDVYAAKNAEGKPSDVLFAHAQALQQRLADAEKRMGDLVSLLPNAELALKALNVAVSVYDVELADNARRGLMELIAKLKPVEGEGS